MFKNLFSKSEFILSITAIVLVLAILFAYYLHLQGFANNICIADALCSALLLLFSGFLLSNLLSYYAPQQKKQIFIIGCALVLSTFWLLACWYIFKYYFTDISYIHWLKKSLPLRYFVALQFITSLGFYNLLWQEQVNNTEMQAQQNNIKTLARDAELFKLRQQLQPHFLFNSLNSINALIGSQPKQARQMVLQLSDFLRKTLKQDDNEMVSLATEMEYGTLYLDIEKVRFGHRLETQISIDTEAMNCLVPNLILQPILENAIKYGLYNTTETVCIDIQASYANQILQVQISNPFDATIAGKPKAGSGFGLQGINRRLQLIYGLQNLLSIQNMENIFTTTLKFPQK